ncbi:MAG TPA: SDR family NAD(P)-dependent oxidoreductase [Acidimicrobiales bacterium]|nr:SDR family NAD(P)-dependent oxidoreductase [Acidimicrobiales bacterium]
MRRTVAVTGADSGIGLHTCAHLAEIGFDVIGVVASREGLERLRTDLPCPASRVEARVADLSDPQARAGLLAGTDVWALVNNAGYMNAGQVRDIPIEDARRQFETMVLAPVDLIQQVLPAMMARGQGRIVNVTSSAVHTSTPLTGWYTAAKAALRELNDALRVELRATGIDVVDIEPGGYATRIWERAGHELAARRRLAYAPDLYDRALRLLGPAQKPMGHPRRVAEVIGDVLTTGDPPAHRRIGPGARWLLLADRVLPDKVWDAVVAGATRTA